MYDFWRKNFVKMKNNCFKEIFDRLLYYGMNYNPHWNRNFEAASPQAPDCTSQFVTWFNLVNILWKGMSHTESALRGAAAKPPRLQVYAEKSAESKLVARLSTFFLHIPVDRRKKVRSRDIGLGASFKTS